MSGSFEGRFFGSPISARFEFRERAAPRLRPRRQTRNPLFLARRLLHQLVDLSQNLPSTDHPHIMSSDVLRSATAATLFIRAVFLLKLFDFFFQLIQTIEN